MTKWTDYSISIQHWNRLRAIYHQLRFACLFSRPHVPWLARTHHRLSPMPACISIYCCLIVRNSVLWHGNGVGKALSPNCWEHPEYDGPGRCWDVLWVLSQPTWYRHHTHGGLMDPVHVHVANAPSKISSVSSASWIQCTCSTYLLLASCSSLIS